MRSVFRWCVVLTLLGFLTSCATNPMTGRSQLSLVPREAALSSAAVAYSALISDFRMKGRIETDTERARRVKVITDRIISEAIRLHPEAATWNWQLHVVNEPNTLNAFCMAGGKMVVFTGLWTRLDLTDDEIAHVIGHEVGHALGHHYEERMSVAIAVGIGTQAAAAAATRRTSNPYVLRRTLQATELAALLAITLPNSRDSETEADQIGIELVARAGFDPRAAVSLWEKTVLIFGVWIEVENRRNGVAGVESRTCCNM